MVPWSPTAQTSVGDEPHTSHRLLMVPLDRCDQISGGSGAVTSLPAHPCCASSPTTIHTTPDRDRPCTGVSSLRILSLMRLPSFPNRRNPAPYRLLVPLHAAFTRLESPGM